MSELIDKYRLARALRPFSFGVALTTCLIGITAAWQQGQLIPLNAVLVLLGGLLLQAGVNLINDHSDLATLGRGPKEQLARRQILRNFRIGMLCFLLATPIGLFLVAERSLSLLWLFLIGLMGALGYTLQPINYKARGLAVVLVFWLMGILMVAGSHVAAGGTLSGAILVQAVPISLLVSLLLLSNELRDYEADRQQGLGTLTVRIGFVPACWVYRVLLGAAFLSVPGLWLAGLIAFPWPLLPVLPFAWRPLRFLDCPPPQRRPLTPATGQLVMVFGLLFCLTLR